MSARPKPAIIPKNKSDPTGLNALERKAMADFARRLKKVQKAYTDALYRFPASPVVNRRYEYQLDPLMLNIILTDASVLVDAVLLDGGQNYLWFSEDYVEPAAIRGTNQAYVNLSQQSATYAARRESLQAILLSTPYQHRMALTYARVFEEMKGFTAKTKQEMARVLTDGIGRGLNPKEVARNLRDQVGIETRRANRIAQTEIPGALRRARWEEAEDAQSLGLKTMLVHISALLPTTRRTHAARHSHLYTIEEIRDWYTVNGNSINCHCSQVETLVDDKGKPLAPSIIEKLKEERKKMAERGYPWAEE
ncbi:phage minor head protein [Yersinia rochesterensis]|uniref:phage minor head protein n=1 Tax=Yersinia rochesterensis TaxID=1604335 RepID=UPI00119F5888|nr:phage minor head protein [Yersinia rochesterensis]